jgi:hypothetical protein
MTAFLALLALCPPALAQAYHPHIQQYNPQYEEGTDYVVQGTDPHYEVWILEPSLPGSPYEFDSYNLDDPNQAAHIKRITALPDVGNVELVIKGHNGRQYGATNIYGLALDPEDGIHATLKEFTISGILGYDENTYVETIAGPLQVGGIHKALHADSITGSCDFGPIMAPLTVATVSGDVTSDYVADGCPITLSTLSDGFFTHYIDPNSPVSIQTVSESGAFTVGDPSVAADKLHSPVTIGSLSGSFHANMIKPDSPVSIGGLTGDGSFEVTNWFLNDPNEGVFFGSQSPVSIASMGSATSLFIKDLRSALNLGDPNDPQPVGGIVTVIATIADSSLTIYGDHEGEISLGGYG